MRLVGDLAHALTVLALCLRGRVRGRPAALLALAGGLALLLARGDLGLQLGHGAGDRRLDQLAVQRAVDDDRRRALELDHHARGAGLVDLAVVEPHVDVVGVAVQRAGQLAGALIRRLGLLAELELGDLVAVDAAAQVFGEHLAVALAQRAVEHPARLAGQALGRPLVAVGHVRDQRVEQLG